LERLDGARVITTSSMAHAFARLDLDDLDAARRFSSWRQYGVTKLANILFTRELARRAPGIVATGFHPGAVGSEFGQDEPGPMRVAMRLARPFLRTPTRGADTGIWLATAPEAASLSGQYVVDRRVQTPRGQGADDTLAAELWRIRAARRARTLSTRRHVPPMRSGPMLFRSSSSALPGTRRSGSVPTWS